MSTKLKLLGVDVASFGDALGGTPGCLEVVVNDAVGSRPTPSWCSPMTHRRCSAASWSATRPAYGVLRPMVG